VTINDLVGIALSICVAAFALAAFAATFYYGGLAIYETARDVRRWLRAYMETSRREREEMLEESMREMTR
jgi:nicotinamidase-related amidase